MNKIYICAPCYGAPFKSATKVFVIRFVEDLHTVAEIITNLKKDETVFDLKEFLVRSDICLLMTDGLYKELESMVNKS